jgi:hypothetical protein
MMEDGVETSIVTVFSSFHSVINKENPADPKKRRVDEIRTHDIHVGK